MNNEHVTRHLRKTAAISMTNKNTNIHKEAFNLLKAF